MYHAANNPGVRQFSFIRASQVWPMPPLHFPKSLPAVIGAAVLAARRTRVGLAVEEHVSPVVTVLADVPGNSQYVGSHVLAG